MFDTMLTAATLLGILALLRLDAGGGWLATLGLGAALAFGVRAGQGAVILVHLLPLALSRPVWSLSADPAPRCLVRPFGHRIGAGLALLCDLARTCTLVGGAEYREEVLWRQSAGGW